MRASMFISCGFLALASAAALTERATANYFNVKNFSFGCTATCDWSFTISDPYTSSNHPAVNTAVKFSGNSGTQTYKACGSIPDTKTGLERSIAAYIDKNDKLQLRYEVTDTSAGSRYDYYGHRQVYAATSGHRQPKAFQVKENKATGIA